MSLPPEPLTATDTLDYLKAIYGTTEGVAHLAVGCDPHLDTNGKYTHRAWVPTTFSWPAEADQLAAEITREAAHADVYACPYLMWAGKRSKGAAVERRLIHCDYDGPLDTERVTATGGFAVASGSEGHAHVYVPLAGPVTAVEHEALCRALGDYLGPHADSKVRDNDVLRPPGTWNHKPTANGQQPAPVTWLVKPNGVRVDPQTLEVILGAAPQPDPAAPAEATTQQAPPVDLDLPERVATAVANVSGDRSADIARIVGACADSNLQLPHARRIVGQRADLVQKLAEMKGRDDVLQCWLKAIDSRQQARRERPGGNAATWFDPCTDDGGGKPLSEQRFGDVTHLEADFWERPSLNRIHTAAKTRLASPWAVLGIAACYALHLVPPGWVLPPLIGGPGSLNWFVALCAVSGGGKNSAAAVAKELLGRPVFDVNVGSGEGLVAKYVIKGGKGEPEGQRPAVHFNVAEVGMLGALKDRSGSTLMPTVLEAFSGGKLGFAYATAGKDRHLDEHTYRLTMHVGVQPAKAAVLLDDADSGTPQRFMWFPAKDVHATEHPAQVWDGVALDLSEVLPQTVYPAWDLTVPEEAAAQIKSEYVKSARGEQDALDGHALFCREKFAYALAILDNRIAMTAEDWRLSGIASEVSSFMRGQVVAELARGERSRAEKRGVLRGVTQAAADSEKQAVEAEQIGSALKWALTKIGEAGGRMKTRDLAHKYDSKKRAVLKAALDFGAGLGQLRLLDDRVTWEKVTE
ncbi:MAG: hypothetical protein QG597_3934 [Actinomycetota bacterium]|nr:hypothetical protein [Actinomycetota bacterium]